MSYPINTEEITNRLGRDKPWLQAGADRGDARYYALCPYCDNPIQLKAVFRRKPGSPQPYGSHVGKALDGFCFDPARHAFCPYIKPYSSLTKTDRRELDVEARDLIELMTGEFDRIVYMLENELGFGLSFSLSAKMLNQWYDDKAYLYVGARRDNLPWMLAYFAPTLNLFNLKLDTAPDLASAIVAKVKDANFDKGRLTKGPAFFKVAMQTYKHHSIINADQSLTETVAVRVQDFTETTDPEDAPLVYESVLTMDHKRFEALLHTPPERARRNQRLLDMAIRVFQERGFG